MASTFGFRTEPVLVSAFVAALLIALVEFGVPITAGQQTAIQTLIAAGFALFARSQVTSESTLRRAGTTTAEVEATAANPYARLRVRRDWTIAPTVTRTTSKD
jgi:hypothetical protein